MARLSLSLLAVNGVLVLVVFVLVLKGEGHEKRSRVKIWRHDNISATCQQTRRVDAVVFRHRLMADAAAEMVKKAAE